MSRGFESAGTTRTDDYLLAVGLSRVPNVRNDNSSGFRAIDVINTEQLANAATATMAFPSDTGEDLSFVSDNVADVSTISIIYLDGDSVRQLGLITLTGTTPVVVPNVSRLNEAVIVSGELAGTVTISTVSTGTLATITSDTNLAILGHYSTGAKERLTIQGLISSMRDVSNNADDYAIGRLYYQPRGQVKKLGFAFGLQRRGASSINFVNFAPESLEGAVDYWITIESNSTTVGVFTRLALTIEEL